MPQQPKRLADEISKQPKPQLARWLLALEALCFVGAGLNHAHDIWQGGWLPYKFAPLPMNAFWTALAGLDLLAAGLLFGRPRAGVVLGLLIMVSDVAVNSYAKYGLGFGGWYGDLSLQLQSMFLGFIIGAVPCVWWSARWDEQISPSGREQTQ